MPVTFYLLLLTWASRCTVCRGTDPVGSIVLPLHDSKIPLKSNALYKCQNFIGVQGCNCFPWDYIHAQESVPPDGKRHAITYNMCRALLLHAAEATEFTVCNANLMQMRSRQCPVRRPVKMRTAFFPCVIKVLNLLWLYSRRRILDCLRPGRCFQKDKRFSSSTDFSKPRTLW